jgi:hypothetical protein
VRTKFHFRNISTSSAKFLWQDLFEHGRELLCDAAGLSDGFQLPVVLGITPVANSGRARDDNPMLTLQVHRS